jgi:hypothetical protein
VSTPTESHAKKSTEAAPADVKAAAEAHPDAPPMTEKTPVRASEAPAPPADPAAAAMMSYFNQLNQKLSGAGPAGPTEGLSETVPGGKFRVGNRIVDCHQRELNEDGSLKYPERQRLDAFGRMV